jgi:hypothetical protein
MHRAGRRTLGVLVSVVDMPLMYLISQRKRPDVQWKGCSDVQKDRKPILLVCVGVGVRCFCSMAAEVARRIRGGACRRITAEKKNTAAKQ